MANNRRRISAIAHVLLLGSVPVSPAFAEDACAPGNLLASRLPRETSGVLHAERLSDDVAAIEGDDWQTDLVLGFLAYFLLCALLGARTPAAAADDVSYRPGPS